MAPLHHHFEKKGWAEPTIVIRFWIVSMILALVGLAHLEDPLMEWPRALFAGRRFAVVGLGRNGLPAAQALAAMGASVTAWDDKKLPRLAHLPLPLRERAEAPQGFRVQSTWNGAGGRGEGSPTHAATSQRDPSPNPSLKGRGTDYLPNFDLRDPTPDLASYDALILSPGIPHNLPTPHPAAAAAIAAGHPRLVGRRAAVSGGARRRVAGAVRGDHRHQRQIHHHRAGGAYPAPRRPHGGGRRQFGPGGARPASARPQRIVRLGNVPPICWSESARLRFGCCRHA